MSRATGIAVLLLAACSGLSEGPDPPVDPVVDTDAAQTEPLGVWRLHRYTGHQLIRGTEDLLGIELSDLDLLPDDPRGAGFDNTEASLDVSPAWLEGWRAVAEEAARRATAVPVDRTWHPGDAQLYLEELDDLTPLETGDPVRLRPGKTVAVEVYLPAAGTYEVVLDADMDAAIDPSPHTMLLEVDGADVTFDATDTPPVWGQRVHRATLSGMTRGLHAFRHEYSPPIHLVDPPYLRFSSLTVRGPLPPSSALPGETLLSCVPQTDDKASWRACAKEVLGPILRRAWREPAEAEVLEELEGLVLQARRTDRPFADGVALALTRVLLSPRYVLRTEVGEAGTPLTGKELATRLAAFLWSSLPDHPLLDRAEEGTLGDPEVLVAEVARMLADPRAEGFVEDFAGQWLSFRQLDDVVLDLQAFPEFDDALRAQMAEETRALARRILTGELPLSALVTVGTSTVGPDLAALYETSAGPGVATGRPGILGHASMHAATSGQLHTSEVRRGLWVLSHLLCESVGEPPPGATDQGNDDLDPLARLDARQRDPVCASCHTRIDPVGTALEHYDPVGRYRVSWPSGERVDAAGTLPDGTEIYGAVELGVALAADDRLAACAADQALTWAFGRGVSTLDPAVREAAVAALVASEGQMPALIAAIALHPEFRRHLETL